MNDKLDAIWEEMMIYSKNKAQLNSNIIIHNEKRSCFFDSFYKNYKSFKDRYMSEKVMYLDRHKVTAILMYTIIDMKIIEPVKAYQDVLPLDNYYLAASVGFSYLLFEINAYNTKKHLSKIEFPDTLFSDKDYKEYFIDMLYILYNEGDFNMLELANIIFLIEAYNIKEL